MSPEDFMVRAEDLADREGISPLSAAILVAAAQGIARDSRSFANLLGVAHALVLRDCVALSESGHLREEKRDARTQRLFYALTDRAQNLLGT